MKHPICLITGATDRGISGQYFSRSKRAPVKSKFDTAENRALLWDLSLNAVEHGAVTAGRRAR